MDASFATPTVGGCPPPVLALLVDRDCDTRKMYAQFLRHSCAIEEADDGREALAKALSQHPDIIVTDSRLPGMSGVELCRILRSDAATRDTAIVFVTGDAFTADVERAQESGADAVLVKPCLPETLFLNIKRLLAQSAELRARARATTAKIREQIERSDGLMRKSREHQERRLTLTRAHVREQTTVPPAAPPNLVCPTCDRSLTYVRSNVGGVSALHAEQWDYYECESCGPFQYRQRTRKLRRVM